MWRPKEIIYSVCPFVKIKTIQFLKLDDPENFSLLKRAFNCLYRSNFAVFHRSHQHEFCFWLYQNEIFLLEKMKCVEKIHAQ